MSKLKLIDGTMGFYNERNEWVATGSMMGRRNTLPENKDEPCKLQLQRVPFVDGCYDRWGAYWGTPANLWAVWGDAGEVIAQVFVRANNRKEAKAKVREILTNAKFYR